MLHRERSRSFANPFSPISGHCIFVVVVSSANGCCTMFFRGVIDSHDLLVMEAALVLASEELGLAHDDINGRERLAHSILALHKAGQSDIERLKIYAISRFDASPFMGQDHVHVASKPKPSHEQSD
jgi:hypothetical protein